MFERMEKQTRERFQWKWARIGQRAKQMRKLVYLILPIVLSSCGERNFENRGSESNPSFKNENLLVITEDGDTLENGYWKYLNANGLSKEGKFKNGVKTGDWKYEIANEVKTVQWAYFDKQKVKFNYPKYLKVSKEIEYPTLFVGDILDNDNFTYMALLEYNLKDMNSSIYDYLYQVNEAFTEKADRLVRGKNFRKYVFKNIDLFTINIQVEQDDRTYIIVSQVFEVNGYLYDFTYKDLSDKMSLINLEIFKDMIYSFESNGVDVFSYNTGSYLLEEDVVFD